VVGHPPAEPVAWGYRGGTRVDVAEFAAMPGTGDVWSTVDDLVRYTEALTSGATAGARALPAMLGPHAETPSETHSRARPGGPATATGYGYGYFTGTVLGHRAWFHPGDNPGYQSFLAHLPDLEVSVAVLCNHEESDLDGVLRQTVSTLASDAD